MYVGEYAAHEKDRRSTLRSALAEAAGMIGFERNGDLVHFASYAPLLARRGNTQWTPDLIYFSGTEVYPTINYHVQKLFGEHAGDEYLDTSIHGDGTKRVTASTVRDSRSGDIILKVVNGSATPVRSTLRWNGLVAESARARRVVLAHANAEAVNPDGAERPVQPVQDEITIQPTMGYELPAHSLTVLRFPL